MGFDERHGSAPQNETLTDEEMRAIVARLQQSQSGGATVRDVAEALGVDHDAVRSALSQVREEKRAEREAQMLQRIGELERQNAELAIRLQSPAAGYIEEYPYGVQPWQRRMAGRWALVMIVMLTLFVPLLLGSLFLARREMTSPVPPAPVIVDTVAPMKAMPEPMPSTGTEPVPTEVGR